MAHIFAILSVVAFALAAVFLGLAVFFWFFFRIPSVIGDLSGRTARKSIARMREANAKEGFSQYRPGSVSHVGQSTPKSAQTAEKAKPRKIAPARQTTQEAPQEAYTVVFSENKADAVTRCETGLLQEAEEVETTGSTEGLLETETEPVRTGGMELTMLDDVMLVFTDEVIR